MLKKMNKTESLALMCNNHWHGSTFRAKYFFFHIFFNLGRQSNRYEAGDTRGDLIRKNIMNVICYIIDCMDTYERLTCKILAMMTWALQLKTKKNLSENELFIANSVDIISQDFIHLPIFYKN